MKKLIALWKTETPVIARLLQAISASIAVLPAYYSSLPEEFKSTIPKNLIGYISIGGLVVTFLLNLMTKKQSNGQG